ncbi:Leucyl aminopeptidase (aminopeptidase T) [Treponema bryantii]|uniref:Leucyl aminopeptidase (Aminopeptidase T) n=1 Tax=Treponema bryantii TaxID=163 RepID=A0A1H9C6A0_9SPIR|nr:aminopeptidase [Treponema bryantii]SEP96669.1 Leucyl aminopeptidase (aminopeptidase T) [Treponema bryantii]
MSLIKKDKNRTPAQVVVQDVVKIKKGERVLIIANPATSEIAQDLYSASCEIGGQTTLMFQPDKTSFDNANPEVLAALASRPDVYFSISNIKLGKDPQATANPYVTEDGQKFTHIADYLMDGLKVMRGAWTPGITVDMMNRTAAIDYKELQSRCARLDELFKNAVSVHVKAPAGTDLIIPINGRALMFDDGDFSKPGTGGNIPAGEVFISPVVGGSQLKSADGKVLEQQSDGCEGVIVYDGSMTFSDGDSIIETPITCKVEKGYVTDISGGAEARRLLKTVLEAELRPFVLEKEGKLPQGQAAVYKKNARNIGELGIGLNPAATITGNMLEDEKAFHTCHFAIGENYDNDAPSLIHLDGVVRDPTITLTYADGTSRTILQDGSLQLE